MSVQHITLIDVLKNSKVNVSPSKKKDVPRTNVGDVPFNLERDVFISMDTNIPYFS